MNNWPPDLEKQLIDNLQSHTVRQLAEMFKTTTTAIRSKIKRMGLVKDDVYKYHDWTDEDIKYVKENYLTKTYAQIGEHLGLFDHQVQMKIKNLGLKKKSRTGWEKKKVEHEITYSRPKAVYNNLDVTKLLDYYANLRTA